MTNIILLKNCIKLYALAAKLFFFKSLYKIPYL